MNPVKIFIALAVLGLLGWGVKTFMSGSGVFHPPFKGHMRIIMLGDSLTEGKGVGPNMTLPAQLETRLRQQGYDVEVINQGVSGNTTYDGRQRIGAIVAMKPDLLIVALGGNDMLRRIEPKEIRDNLDFILTQAKNSNTVTLLAGIDAPALFGPLFAAKFEKAFEDMAEKHGVTFLPDLLEDVMGVSEKNQADVIHPNAAGVATMVDNLAPYVENIIKHYPGEQ